MNAPANAAADVLVIFGDLVQKALDNATIQPGKGHV